MVCLLTSHQLTSRDISIRSKQVIAAARQQGTVHVVQLYTQCACAPTKHPVLYTVIMYAQCMPVSLTAIIHVSYDLQKLWTVHTMHSK